MAREGVYSSMPSFWGFIDKRNKESIRLAGSTI
jgi:hypothetical protein